MGTANQLSASHAAPALARHTETAIIQPGRNCWRVARADRVAIFIDGAAYFRHLRAALLRARHSVLIIGWDFDCHIRLDPVSATDESIKTLLARLVAERPSLRVRILIWGFSPYYGTNHQPAVSLGEPWHAGLPRIEFAFDNDYPIGASHHEKIVCVDDAVAFVGGIDLTAERWDTSAHEANDPRRVEYDGTAFRPVHDLHMAVAGEAARAVCAHARQRWASATGQVIESASGDHDPWPTEAQPLIHDVDVAIARTRPAYGELESTCEIAALNIDAIKAARRSIYIETQYFTARLIGDALAEWLERPSGPQIVVVVTKASKGWVEQFAMGTNRERLLRRLKAADRFGRLRVYYPVVPTDDGSEQPVSIHSKLVIVDDRFLRIGSSNLNNRSMGVDTECDLAIEVRDEAKRRAVANLRNRLLGEHLGVPEHEMAAAIDRTGSLFAAIDSLNTGRRGLRPVEVDLDGGTAEPLTGTAILDPAEPINFAYLRQVLLPGYG